MRHLALLLVLAGCGQTSPRPLDLALADATTIIWNQTYARTEPAPAVTWVTELDCAQGRGFRARPWGLCVAGLYLNDRVYVAIWATDGAQPLSQTVLAHEYWHAALDRISGDPDPEHSNGTWTGSLSPVTRANTALEDHAL